MEIVTVQWITKRMIVFWGPPQKKTNSNDPNIKNYVSVEYIP